MAKHDMTCEERQVAERAQRTLAEAQLRYGVRLPREALEHLRAMAHVNADGGNGVSGDGRTQ
ncbi:hypothetical protein FHX69_0177 [Prauserella muralis]|nr:hypothetical protein FHX69_0177 [Prauserella muralis]